MTYITTQHHTIIQRHKILLLLKLIKFFLLGGILAGLWWLAFTYKETLVENHPNILSYIIVPILFAAINYIYIRLILEVIIYFHDLVIFYKDKIVIIKNSLFFQNDMEIIDMYRIMKLNVTCHGLFSNILGYGNIRIEQANDDVKIIHFVPHPERIVELLETRRSLIVAERGKEKKDDKSKDKDNYWERK